MKGQRLFVRALGEGDLPSIAALHAAAGEPLRAGAPSLPGLAGRLAGSTVAYLVWHRDGRCMAIVHVLVAADLRGIRIGRGLLAEALKIAATEGADTVRVAQDCKLAPFFERCGFVSNGDTLIKPTR